MAASGIGSAVCSSATNKKLKSMGIHTIGDLAETDERFLNRRLGKMGNILWAFANGYDDSPVKLENTSAPIKSVGNSTTTPRDMETDEDVKIVIYILAESVAARLVTLVLADVRSVICSVSTENSEALTRTAY